VTTLLLLLVLLLLLLLLLSFASVATWRQQQPLLRLHLQHSLVVAPPAAAMPVMAGCEPPGEHVTKVPCGAASYPMQLPQHCCCGGGGTSAVCCRDFCFMS
jgi:hypothetical protein